MISGAAFAGIFGLSEWRELDDEVKPPVGHP
jgi:hypothetical protein